MINRNITPTLADAVAAALSASTQPLDIDELVAKVTARRPRVPASRSAVQRTLQRLYQAVPVGPGRYGWLTSLLQGATLCHPLSSDEIRRGSLLLDELEHSVFFPQFFQEFQPDDRTVEITMFGGETLHVDAVLERKMWSLRLGKPYVEWLSDLGAESHDDLLINVADAAQGKYEIRARLREMRDERAIEKRNIRLAVLAEELVVEDSRKRDVMPTWDLVARLIGRGFYHETPTTDDLHYVLHEYSMLRFEDGMGYQLDSEAAAQMIAPDEIQPDVSGYRADSQSARKYRGFAETGRDDVEDASGPEPDQEYLFGDLPDGDADMEEPICPAYEEYLESYAQDSGLEPPLGHEEFHLLEAELDMLLQIEAEFGGLLPEQEARKELLAERLFIDPDTLASMGWDAPDDPNLEDPPFWSN